MGDCVHFYQDAFADLAHLISLYREHLSGEDAPAAITHFERDIDLPFLLDEIPAAGERTLDGLKSATELIKATQELVHPAGGSGVRCDVEEATRAAAVLARHRFEPVATIAIELDRLPPAHCGHGELVQVMVNLLANAADAIASAPDHDEKGTIEVTSRRDGDHVCLLVRDDGPGIPEEIRDRVFDPFFTTKEVGSGTGQGLAISQSVVQRYGGTLSFETEAGAGTTFELRLPVADPTG